MQFPYIDENLLVHLGKFHVAACHDFGGCLKKRVHVDGLHAGCRALGERGDERAREACTIEVHTHTYGGGGVEHGVDARLGVVAHDEAAELESCVDKTALTYAPQFDGAVGVFEV